MSGFYCCPLFICAFQLCVCGSLYFYTVYVAPLLFTLSYLYYYYYYILILFIFIFNAFFLNLTWLTIVRGLKNSLCYSIMYNDMFSLWRSHWSTIALMPPQPMQHRDRASLIFMLPPFISPWLSKSLKDKKQKQRGISWLWAGVMVAVQGLMYDTRFLEQYEFF